MFNTFDSLIAIWVNGLVGRSAQFDAFVVMVACSGLFKGAGMVTALWWLWFRNHHQDRDAVLSSVLGATLGLFLARALAHLLPFRDRPFHALALQLHVANGQNASGPQLWSAFPSDHATAFFALATGIYFASRRAGVVAFVWAAVVVCAPRLYLGMHYPTDLLAGALLGVLTASTLQTGALRRAVDDIALPMETRSPVVFYAAFITWSYSMATMFDGLRQAYGLLVRLHW